jgi:hypothetical protein
MGITALSGPYLQYGVTTTGSTDGLTGRDVEYNDQRAPMVADLGNAMMDPRTAYAYVPGGAVDTQVFGFYNGVGLIDVIPTAKASNAIVAAVTASSSLASTALTLRAGSTARGTYDVTTLVAPETGATISSILMLGSSEDTQYEEAVRLRFA